MLKENDNELCIELDPGIAFGTGDHQRQVCV